MKATFNVPAIHCHHCANTIKIELSELAGILDVDVNIDQKQVSVTYDDPANTDTIKELLDEIGYPASN